MKRILRLAGGVAALLVACLVLAVPATAQEEGQSTVQQLDDQVQILSASVDEDAAIAELVVAIPPSMGEVAPDASNFALLQGGRLRGLLVEQIRDEVDVVLVIDTSGSMRGAPIAAARSAALDFVAQMPDQARVAVIGFGPTPVVASEFTRDRADSAAAISSLSAAGETALWDGLVAAGTLTEDRGRSARYIVVLSDGADTVSSASLDDAVGAISSNTTPVGLYVVTLETPESDHTALVEAADRLNGQVLTTGNTEDLEALYSEIAGRLQNRYSVRFRPSAAEDIVLSIAVDGAIATARTTLSDLNETPAGETAGGAGPTDTVPRDLNGSAGPELGSVIVGEPGLLGTSTGLWIGAAAMFVALCIVLGFIAVPAMKVQPVASVRSADPRSRASAINERLSAAADRFIRDRDDSGTVDRALDAAGLDLRAGEFVVLAGVTMVSGGLVVSLLAGQLAGIITVGLVGLIAVGYVNLRIRKRRNKFADQLQNTISIMTGSLRAGRGLPQALEMVAQEAGSPTSEEFRRVIVETRVGRDPIASLEAVAERMDSVDLEWITQAIAINRDLGGDLIELLENVARTVRDRNRLALQVRSLSAEGRASGWVIMALPIAMYAYLRLVNPQYISLLHTTTPGIIASVIGIVAMLLGGLWIRKLVNIRF